MLNEFYDFIAKKIYSFFQTSASGGILLKGESFCLNLDNDEIVTNAGLKVNLEVDDVRVGGTQIFYEEFVYFMLNKPAGVISATEDFMHETVLDLLDPSDLIQEPHPVGRLDIDTEGFLILTK